MRVRVRDAELDTMFAAFITLLGRDYNHGAREDLTSLYEGDELQRKLTNTSFKIAAAQPVAARRAAAIPWLGFRLSQ